MLSRTIEALEASSGSSRLARRLPLNSATVEENRREQSGYSCSDGGSDLGAQN